MKTALFVRSNQELKLLPTEGAERFDWTALDTVSLEGYRAIFLIGSDSLDNQVSLSSAACAKLWAFAEQGGLIYGEVIEVFDFPTSRLFGWKQDFPVTRRTMEKLQSNLAIPRVAEGDLLEWTGTLQRGFAFDSEVKLSMGVYRDTHQSVSIPASEGQPGLIIRKLGAGTIVYCAFSLFSCPDPESLRPYSRWLPLMQYLKELSGIPFRMWEPFIDLSANASAAEAVKANVQWFRSSGMLPASNGAEGVYENIHSVTAKLSPDLRPDCHAHSALMFYLYGKWSGEKQWLETADGLLHYLFEHDYQDMDSTSPSYGFFKWYDFPGKYPHQLFTDDNAWVCFVLLYLYRRTGNETYKIRGLLVAEALLATQREDGLRPNVLTRTQLGELGREGASALPPSLNPHFESITHAAFVQAYLVTGEKAYMDTALTGARTLLARESEHRFMYSRTSGLTRMLLPLSYLSKHDETGEIAAGLERTFAYLISHQHSLGGIEEADNPDPGRFGMEDAGVYIANNEGIADQLYTNNFLVMNSWEAWKATGNPAYRKLYDQVSTFMSSIQIQSGDNRYDGGWMRAFDLNKGEYFGNNGDTGWGPYCMESGWTNAITSAGLLLGLLDESLYD